MQVSTNRNARSFCRSWVLPTTGRRSGRAVRRRLMAVLSMTAVGRDSFVEGGIPFLAIAQAPPTVGIESQASGIQRLPPPVRQESLPQVFMASSVPATVKNSHFFLPVTGSTPKIGPRPIRRHVCRSPRCPWHKGAHR
jgi:hypothetical protein